jgi:hypothetical protein
MAEDSIYFTVFIPINRPHSDMAQCILEKCFDNLFTTKLFITVNKQKFKEKFNKIIKYFHCFKVIHLKRPMSIGS